MKKYIWFIIAGVILVALVIYAMGLKNNKPESTSSPTPIVNRLDPKNGTFEIEGELVTLNNGLSEIEINSGSETIITTEYFGNDVAGDFNGDGKEDVAFILVQAGGGTGVFYYVAAILGNGNNGTSTNTVYIGDRIAPQGTEFKNGMIVVNFADRKPGEPFSTQPSVGTSKYFKVVDGILAEETP